MTSVVECVWESKTREYHLDPRKLGIIGEIQDVSIVKEKGKVVAVAIVADEVIRE